MGMLAIVSTAQAQPNQLATVDVRQYGAIPDDGKDDADAIQKAIDAMAANQTLVFPAGVFELSKTLDPRGGGRSFRGATTLKWMGDQITAQTTTVLKAPKDEFAFYLRASNVTFTNLSFNGRAIFADRPNNQMNAGLIIDNCWFILDVTGERQDAIEFTTGLENSRITNCVFDPIKGDNAIYGYNWNNLTIANNQFFNGNEAIHLVAHADGSKNLLIEQNYFAGISRMAAEIQGGGVNTVVQDNYYEKPQMSGILAKNDGTFAYSIISDRSKGTRIRRNVSIAPQRPDGIGVRIIFELGGFDFVCEDNFSDGGNHVVAVNGAKATGIVRNNRLMNYLEGPRNSNEAKATFVNNGSDVNLPIDLLKRGKPGPNRRFAE
jgi:hypothetical protein